MRRRPSNRYGATAPQRPKQYYSDKDRKPRHENGGEFAGDNKNTPLGDFLRVLHQLPDRRKVDGE